MPRAKRFVCGNAPSKGNPWDIDQIKKCNRDSGGHWFDPGAMRFFRSRVSNDLHQGRGGIYFVSSEQFVPSSGQKAPRMYSVHRFDPKTYRVDTVGDFQKYDTKAKAERAAKALAGEPTWRRGRK